MAWKNVQYENGKYRTSEGGGGGSSTFAGLDDVSFNNIQNGQVPKYNSTTQKWENADESGGGGTVTDVQVDGVSVVNPQGVAEIETPNANGIEYNNQQSGLQATNMQDAIDELAQGSGGGGVEDVEVNGTSVVNAQKVAEIKSYKEVTQAEYNALPDSKLNDGILYAIKDSAGADGFPPLIYSDEEREVGVWRDGKPLYQKTISFNISGGTNTTSLGVTNMGICLMICAFKVDSANYSTFIPFVDIEAGSSIDSWSAIVYRVNLSSGDINYRAASRFAGQTVYATFQYTKTTDVAGSGTWTTQGALAHHYSTDEKVIGTWIDGKPLYEKTIDCGAFHNAGSKTVAHNISGLKFVISYDGSGKYDSGEFTPIPFPQSSNALNYQAKIYVDSTNITIMYGANDIAQIYITLRYTKTTD